MSEKFNLALILTACIEPKNIPFLERKSVSERLSDYKKSFNFWCKNNNIKKIIFIENSGYNLEYFKNLSKNYKNKEIEIISSNTNNSFDRKLGKGFGEHLILNTLFEKSQLIKKVDYFIKVSGRFYIKNYNKLYSELEYKRSDINLHIKDSFTYADSRVFSGSINFLENYVLKETSNINDTNNIFFENCLAKAAILAINDKLKFSHLETFPFVEGIIGTNNKKIKTNFWKRLRFFIIAKIKNYLFINKKY